MARCRHSTELLEVASGSGGPALFTVETTGCRLFGVDLHDEGVAAANRAAQERGLADRARFVRVDARKTSPVDAGSFDAVICIDSINHMYERSAVLREWRRVLRPSGRVLFTDPITDSIAELGDGRWLRRCAGRGRRHRGWVVVRMAPKPQPTRPNPARDPEFRNDPRVQPTPQIIPARNLGSDPRARRGS